MAATVIVNFKVGGEDAIARAVRSVSQSAQRAAREQSRATQQAEREQTRASTRAATAAERAAQQQIRASERAANAAQKAAEKRVAAAERAAAAEVKAAERAAAAQKRIDERTAAATQKRLAAEAKAAERAAARIPSIGQGVGRAGLVGARSGAGMLAAGGALVAGGIGMSSITNAIESNRDLANRSALLQNASGLSMNFQGVSRQLSSRLGVNAGEILGGIEGLAAKGGGAAIKSIGGTDQEFIQNYAKLGEVARGAGISMKDLGDVTATLINNGVGAQDLVSTVEALVQQGKDGAVEFKDLATLLDASAGALGRFNMSASRRISVAGGLTQIAKKYGRASAAEATTSVTDIASELLSKGDVIQGLTGGKVTGIKTVGGVQKKVVEGGVEVGTDASRAQMKSIETLLPEIIARADKAGNLGALTGAGGLSSGASMAILGPLIQAYKQGLTNEGEIAKDGEHARYVGQEAVTRLMAQFTNVAPKEGESKKAFDNVMRSDRFGVAMVEFENKLGNELAPKMGELADATITLANAFTKTVNLVSTYPKTMAAGLIALMAAKGAAGQALANIQAGAMPGVGGALGKAANVAGGAAAVAGSLVAGAAVGWGAASAVDDAAQERDKRKARDTDTLINRLYSGDATQEEIARAKAELAKTEEVKKSGYFSRVASAVGGSLSDAAGAASRGEIGNTFSGLGAAFGQIYNQLDSSIQANAEAQSLALQQGLKAATLNVKITNVEALRTPGAPTPVGGP